MLSKENAGHQYITHVRKDVFGTSGKCGTCIEIFAHHCMHLNHCLMDGCSMTLITILVLGTLKMKYVTPIFRLPGKVWLMLLLGMEEQAKGMVVEQKEKHFPRA